MTASVAESELHQSPRENVKSFDADLPDPGLTTTPTRASH